MIHLWKEPRTHFTNKNFNCFPSVMEMIFCCYSVPTWLSDHYEILHIPWQYRHLWDVVMITVLTLRGNWNYDEILNWSRKYLVRWADDPPVAIPACLVFPGSSPVREEGSGEAAEVSCVSGQDMGSHRRQLLGGGLLTDREKKQNT